MGRYPTYGMFLRKGKGRGLHISVGLSSGSRIDAGVAVAFIVILLSVIFPLDVQNSRAETEALNPISDTANRDVLNKQGRIEPSSGINFHYENGLYLEYRYKNLVKLELGGRFLVDGGYIGADQTLQNAFQNTYPPLRGWNDVLRSARVNVVGTFYQAINAKVEVEFAQTRELKDAWVGSAKKIPVIGYIKVGNMKEPFSLEELTSFDHITFMERSLPTQAFSPNRNVGFLFNNSVLNERITWAAGGFYNTGDLNNLYSGGDPQDKWNTANGYSVAARVTGLPWYEEGGKRLLHLGLSYNFRARNMSKDGAEEKFGTRPESYLTDEKIVSTGTVAANGTNLINGELAWVWGAFSLQGEYFHAFTNAEGSPRFWGYYVYGSLFLTGEHRKYDTVNGIFVNTKPRRSFNPSRGGWGAWEIVVRLSYLDLNDGNIKGGKELDFTAGLNWYLNPNIRLMFNYIRSHVEDRDTSPSVSNGYANTFQARLQFAF